MSRKGPKPKDDDVLEILLDELRTARADGRTFADAWAVAVMNALRGTTGRERDAWNEALGSTRASWECAWYRGPAQPVELRAAELRYVAA